MSYPLGPVALSDNYTPQSTVETQACVRITGWVSNAPMFYQLRGEGAADWGEEHYIPCPPKTTYFFSFDRAFTGARFRNAIAGTPATAVVQLLTEADLPY